MLVDQIASSAKATPTATGRWIRLTPATYSLDSVVLSVQATQTAMRPTRTGMGPSTHSTAALSLRGLVPACRLGQRSTRSGGSTVSLATSVPMGSRSRHRTSGVEPDPAFRGASYAHHHLATQQTHCVIAKRSA